MDDYTYVLRMIYQMYIEILYQMHLLYIFNLGNHMYIFYIKWMFCEMGVTPIRNPQTHPNKSVVFFVGKPPMTSGKPR